MEEQLIAYSTANLAKEKGFDIESNGHAYFNVNGKIVEGHIAFSGEYENLGLAPTQSLLQRWLREKHKIDVWCERFSTEEPWIWQCPKANRTRILDSYYIYEEALEKGLQEALKLIK